MPIFFAARGSPNLTTLIDTPSGDCDVVWFELAGQAFLTIRAGTLFKFNPSIVPGAAGRRNWVRSGSA